jgi:alpha-maltose-1-phosphate synthase
LHQQLQMIYPKLAVKAKIIPHGTLSLFRQWQDHPVKREPFTCLFFGRMEKYRGLDNLVKIGGILKETLPGTKIIVAGKGSDLHVHKKAMEQLGIFEVHDSFIPDKDVFRYFRRASLLLLPYHEASQSGVVSMSLPFALPAVATAVGSIPEVIVDGVHGRLVAPGDIAGFASAVCELLSDTGKLERMRSACMELAEKLEFNVLAKDFVSLYEKAVMVGRLSPVGGII